MLALDKLKQFKKYENMKDSGVEWLGEIPEHWNIRKLSRSFYIIGSGTTPKSSKQEYYENGTIPWINSGDLNDEYLLETKKSITEEAKLEYNLKLYDKDSVVIALYGATIGKLAIMGIEATVNQACCVINRSRFFENQFLFYYLLSIRKDLINLSAGGGQPNISQEIVKSIRIPHPSIDEQQLILNFINQETSKLDQLISKKQRLIDLLTEKRQALITQAVTKGLDPSVPMKDSGVEWLGEIPEHWEVQKLRWISRIQPSNVDKKSRDDEESVLLCNYTDVYYNEYITNEIDFMKATASNSQRRKFVLKEGDTIITKDSEDPNDIAVPTFVPQDLDGVICGYHLTQIRPKEGLTCGEYIFRSFQSTPISNQLSSRANGITRFGLTVNAISQSLMLLPSYEEQISISSFLQKETYKLDQLISKITDQIDLIKEYRQALITNAVTGKIDVRGEVD